MAMFLAKVLITLCTAWAVAGCIAVVRTARASRQQRLLASGVATPGVSVLKPLCGADPGLLANLESFFQQDYGRFELVFGVQNERDPAIAVVETLMARYPAVNARLVLHDFGVGINPKVQNLRGMLPSATHDLILISDSNVRAPRRYVREMVATFTAPRAATESPIGLVTNMFAGAGEDSVGAALENVQLNGFCVAGCALPTTLGDSLVVGKSMLMARSEFERLGGFRRVADVLAEDYVIGKMFQHGGYAVKIAPTVLLNVTSQMTVKGFFDRHLRWGMLRFRLRPATFLLEILSSPVALLPVAWALWGPLALVWMVGVLFIRDVLQWAALRGRDRLWVPMLLGAARDLCMLLVWLRVPLKRHIKWRGNRARLGAGTLLFPPRTDSGR